jgi:hypothetical protein
MLYDHMEVIHAAPALRDLSRLYLGCGPAECRMDDAATSEELTEEKGLQVRGPHITGQGLFARREGTSRLQSAYHNRGATR